MAAAADTGLGGVSCTHEGESDECCRGCCCGGVWVGSRDLNDEVGVVHEIDEVDEVDKIDEVDEVDEFDEVDEDDEVDEVRR